MQVRVETDRKVTIDVKSILETKDGRSLHNSFRFAATCSDDKRVLACFVTEQSNFSLILLCIQREEC